VCPRSNFFAKACGSGFQVRRLSPRTASRNTDVTKLGYITDNQFLQETTSGQILIVEENSSDIGKLLKFIYTMGETTE
jgi:hypothetical protein